MRPRYFAPLLAAAFLMLPAPMAHASPAQKDRSSKSRGSGEEQFNAFFAEFSNGNYSRALALAEKMDPPDTKEGRAFKNLTKAMALLGLNRIGEAMPLFAEAEKLWPDEPFVTLMKFHAGYYTEHPEVATAALDRLLARFPDSVRDLEREQIWYLMRQWPESEKKRNDDRRVALAQLQFDGPTGDYFSLSAVRILLDRGDLAGASEILRNIDEPQIIENLLIQKRYSALWPKIEAMAGANIERARQTSVETAQREFAKDPSSFEKLQFLINALRNARRLDEAIAYRSKLPATREAMAFADDQVGWAVNNVALAMYEDGRTNDADALFELLNTAPIENDNWRVSMIINRLELLVVSGQFEKAATLIPATEAARGSPYAEQLVRRLKFCTFTNLGKKDEAAKVLPDLMAHAKDSYEATVDALLCAGQLDEAEKLVLEAIKDDDFQEDFVRAAQPVGLTSDDPSKWQGRWKELRQRPAVAKEFDRLGRDMPAKFLPPPLKKAGNG